MKLHQIRNATIITEYSGKRFLIDPMFAGVNEGGSLPFTDVSWPLHDLPISPKDLVKNIDAVIITHLHTDHFDKYAQDVLPKGVNIFVQDIYDKHALEKEHFTNVEVLKSEGTVFEGIKLYKTECMHGIRALAEPVFLANGMRWEAMGVVFKGEDEPTLYLAGDTIWFDGVKQAINIHKPDYIVLNAACTQTPQGMPVLMGISDIKELHSYYPQGKLIASHLDCIDNAALSRTAMRNSEIKDYIYLPADGEIIMPE